MNGFIYTEGTNGSQSHSEIERFLERNPGTLVEKRSFIGGDTLVAWGNTGGDVHYCQKGNDCLLILNGYVSEVSHAPEVTDQTRVAEWLLKSIELDSSNAALAALLDRLHGSFGIVYRNLKKGELLCITDRMASRPVWKTRRRAAWTVSSHANAIALAVPPAKFDLGTLGAFLLYGGPVEPRKSLYAGVEAAPPGTIVRLGKSGSAEESRWYRFRHQADEALSFSAWIDLACERLVQSASRIARQCARPVVFFSGGIDSRLAAAALKAAGANPLLVTLGDARNLEVRVAAQAARAMGLQQVVILRDKHWYLRALPKAVFESGGNFLWTHGHFSEAIRMVRKDHDAEVFLLGDFCEAFSKLLCSDEIERHKLWSPEEFARDFDQVRMAEYKPKHRERTLSLLNPEIRGEVEASVTKDVFERYQGMAGTSNDPRIMVDQFSRWDSVATISTFFMLLDVRGSSAERNLMFDKGMHELLERLPSGLREGRNLGALMVKRLSPRAGRVVSSNTLLPICWPQAAHRFSKKCKPVLGKVRRFIQGASHRTAGAWPEKSALYGADPEWRSYFEKALNADALFDHALFDRDRVRQAWNGFLSGDRGLAWDIEKLVHFSALSTLRNSGWEAAGQQGVGL